MNNFTPPRFSKRLKLSLFIKHLWQNNRRRHLKDLSKFLFLNTALIITLFLGLFLLASVSVGAVNQSFRGKCAPHWTTLNDQCQNKKAAIQKSVGWNKANDSQLRATNKELSKLVQVDAKSETKLLSDAGIKGEKLGKILEDDGSGIDTTLAFLTLLKQEASPSEKEAINKVTTMLYTFERTSEKAYRADSKLADEKEDFFMLFGLFFFVGVLSLFAALVIFASPDHENSWPALKQKLRFFEDNKWKEHCAPAWALAMKSTPGTWTWSDLVWLDNNRQNLDEVSKLLDPADAASLRKITYIFESARWQQAVATPADPTSRQLVFAAVAKTLPIIPTIIVGAIKGDIDLAKPKIEDLQLENKQVRRHANPLLTR